jgi:hypothetical protein
VEFLRFLGKNFHHSPPFSMRFVKLSSYSASLLISGFLVDSFSRDSNCAIFYLSFCRMEFASSLSFFTF